MNRLVIVQCANKKIWDNDPNAGPTPAGDAYTSPYFQGNKEYAKKFGDRWMILSAKYGFIEPSFVIPGNYDVSFKKPSPEQISHEELRRQVRQKSLTVLTTLKCWAVANTLKKSSWLSKVPRPEFYPR